MKLQVPLRAPTPRLVSMLLLTVLAGCAGEARREIYDAKHPLASILIEKQPQKAGSDCAVSVTIGNRMQTAWDGASYHIGMLDRKGVSIGKLVGSPHRKTEPGQALVDAGQVLGVKCEAIAGTALVYFGYYPAGRKQVPAHNHAVELRLK